MSSEFWKSTSMFLIVMQGTGTQAGDVQEMEALASTIAGSHTADNRLFVGSVKSNVSNSAIYCVKSY